MSFAADRKQRTELRHRGWAKGHSRILDIREGDNVEVLTGKDRGKRGVVERTHPERQRIVVRGINVLKRHTKAGVKGAVQGGIVDFNAPIAYSNVQLVCSACDKRTRIGHTVDGEGLKRAVCRKCGETQNRSGA